MNQSAINTVSVSPIELVIGDKVRHHGALMEVMHIVVTETLEDAEGVRVAACISRLVGDDMGAIPRGWFDTRESMLARGCGEWARDLRADGLYWNVQGNARARVAKLVE